MTTTAAGALVGLLAAAGILALFAGLRAMRRPSLLVRVAPFVPLSPQASAALHSPASAFDVLAAAATSMLRPNRGLRSDVRQRRLLPAQRLDQLAWSALGAIAGGALALFAIGRDASPVALLVLPLIGIVVGLLWCDRLLARRARQRSARIGRELPNAAELLAFAVAAGEPPLAALDRVANTMEGELAEEIAQAVRHVRAGSTLDEALRALSDDAASPAVERFVDGLLVSMERGTPMAEVLRAQAADARAADRRQLMELAGRKDTLMIAPVVFLVLPTVVLIAVFPGFQSLNLIVP